jgi:catechol 2,3-dioxygenase-like lactoylglutathione lyase family enzyme
LIQGLRRIDHIGIIVADISASSKVVAEILGLPLGRTARR